MSDSSLNSVVSFKRQKFWHVQISVILEGELLSCDMKVEALSVAEACRFCIRNVAADIALTEFSESDEDAEYISTYLEAATDRNVEKLKAGIVFKRIVLVTNPAMMCAGGSGMRVSAKDDQGKQEQKVKIEVKESERNKNYG